MSENYPLLSKLDSPADLRLLPADQLPALADELRRYIIEVVSARPGHLGASLGVVELAVALHYVFDTPNDRLVWDVGHQAYAHKILTGRREQFRTNRQYKGLSGFPRRSESPYDAFGTGHSSTSISAALGMSLAAAHQGQQRTCVAVIGDGALTGGMAFEGLNHGGSLKSNLLVILNDNNISIDPSVGGLKEYLLDITTSRTYNRLKDEAWDFLGRLDRIAPRTRAAVQKIDNAVKSALLKQSNMFESMGFRYFGPIDGHDVQHLTQVLSDLKQISGPKFLHVHTVKGKGYTPAELNQTAFHAPGLFDVGTGQRLSSAPSELQPPLYQDVFGETLVELARQDERVLGITPAMASGCSMTKLMEAMPHRAYDVGIAEQHAVTLSAGLAADGMVPFCNIYSTFMQRAFDQVIHDVALQQLHVVFCLDRGGLVGDDGPTHHGAFDLAYMRMIPNMVVAAPMDEVELRNMMYTALTTVNGPFCIRYPRGRGVTPDWRRPMEPIEIGRAQRLRSGDDVAILSIGIAAHAAIDAAKRLSDSGVEATVVDMRFVKPLDETLLTCIAQRFRRIVTVEDGCLVGGFGSAVLEWMADSGYSPRIVRLGIPDRFVEHGPQAQLYADCGYSAGDIYDAVVQMIDDK
ncbi:MAG: 1-deoxy-D-xylulose-5-phosphate synthase [Bacteroidales bacterium]|nr:1-deoxy-D-xylulose-5-phosphate synthase [Bacteroidales bacterium]